MAWWSMLKFSSHNIRTHSQRTETEQAILYCWFTLWFALYRIVVFLPVWRFNTLLDFFFFYILFYINADYNDFIFRMEYVYYTHAVF